MTFDIDQMMDAITTTLSSHQIDLSRVIFGVIGDANADGDIEYETFVGPTSESERAMMLSVAARDLVAESQQQMNALASDAACPDCGSGRYGNVQRRSGPRLSTYPVCMDCHSDQSGAL